MGLSAASQGAMLAKVIESAANADTGFTFQFDETVRRLKTSSIGVRRGCNTRTETPTRRTPLGGSSGNEKGAAVAHLLHGPESVVKTL